MPRPGVPRPASLADSGSLPRTLGTVNTGLVIFDAPDEQAARQMMEEDPVIRGGYALGEVRPFRVSLLRGRD